MSNLNSTDKLALALGKLSFNFATKLNLSQGSNLPGKIALKISPNLFKSLSINHSIIAITGTNGKSTTAGLINSILKSNGIKPCHNSQGANLITGLTSTLIQNVNINGDLNSDLLLLEIDEATLPKISNQTKLNYLLVTNLFRDQLDRFGELDTTKRLIENSIQENMECLILNADDPNVAQIRHLNNKRIYFGLDKNIELEYTQENNAIEIAYCAQCQSEINYHTRFYNQLGDWFCSNCDNKRPNCDILISEISVENLKMKLKLSINGNSFEINSNITGIYNAYNLAASLALSLAMNLDIQKSLNALLEYRPLFGRSEIIEINGTKIVVQLIKNPAGASLALKNASNNDLILIAINDNYADGQDVSWLWDTNFEILANNKNNIIVSGSRSYDMAVRLKYANFDFNKIMIEPDLAIALEKSIELAKNQNLTIRLFPTYTCLLSLQNIFKKLGYKMSGLI